ncbi:MAG TPA: hypothetical protein DEB39_04695 [Planctomycetaceae bacterium]|nr:hypothetical protein [Planctomycetaceae bacterium]
MSGLSKKSNAGGRNHSIPKTAYPEDGASRKRCVPHGRVALRSGISVGSGSRVHGSRFRKVGFGKVQPLSVFMGTDRLRSNSSARYPAGMGLNSNPHRALPV